MVSVSIALVSFELYEAELVRSFRFLMKREKRKLRERERE
jgi:hypothetical protein